MADRFDFQVSLYVFFLGGGGGGHNSIHSHNLFSSNNQRLGSTSDPGFWSRVKTLQPRPQGFSHPFSKGKALGTRLKTLLLLRGALGKFHVIEEQNARDQVTSDRWCKRTWSDFVLCIP